ncbi:MAG: S8 family serine peptidase [Candidatus Riflebacteria bacterium]|nr:S8 family serine peptidase [Candidatus Riflebacteria bacterium]
MRKTLLSAALALCCWFGAGFAGSAVQAGPNGEARYLVHFRTEKVLPPNGDHTFVVSTLQKQLENNLSGLDKLSGLKNITRLWISNSIAVTTTPEGVAKLKSLPNVTEVKPTVYRIWIDKDIERHSVKADTQAQWSISKVRAPEVWSKYKIDGTGVVVGHLDTGIDATHPALAGKVLAFKDFTAAHQTTPYDDQGHGSHTAGSIAGGNGVGVAPGARLICGKIFDSQGGAEDAGLLEAMQWVMDPDGNPATNDGPKLVSNSWGSDDSTDQSFRQAVQNWVAAGILPVFAAGNNGPQGKVGTPGGYPQAWAVGATTKTDTIAYFSSVGPVAWDGVTLVKPDISAPGHGVISCAVGGGLVANSGTSMACPHVAGLAALMFQANPSLKMEEVRSIAEATALDLGTPGKDNTFGAGRFDAMACITKLLGNTSLDVAFAAYPASLEAERSLIGIQASSPLAAPLAHSLVIRALELDAGEFRSLQQRFASNPIVSELLKEASSARLSDELQK